MSTQNNISKVEFITEANLDELSLALFAHVDQVPRSSKKDPTKYSNQFKYSFLPRFVRGKNPPIPASDRTATLTKERPFVQDGVKYLLRLKPAIITNMDKNAKRNDYLKYPGSLEALIEEILLVMATNGHLVKATVSQTVRYGVSFTYSDIRRELQKHGRTRSFTEVKTSLEVLRDSTAVLSPFERRGKEINLDIFSTAILDQEVRGRGADKCFVFFSDQIVSLIDEMAYRQYNFSSTQENDSDVARYLHRYIVNEFRSVSIVNDIVEVNAVHLLDMFGKNEVTKKSKQKDLKTAITLLMENGLVSNYRCKGEVYQICLTEKFIDEIIKSNAKRKGLITIKERIESGEIAKIPPKQASLAF
ncbi:hypothetical protein [Alteromonas sp. 14N.309.X.WAT.G.H12]|uniref:hypothetical protein n=1 Tax=Alteromonas sp. 14N.309.X.WAT.G.H12 TaxID=3120824 RepID=UPI002FD5929C